MFWMTTDFDDRGICSEVRLGEKKVVNLLGGGWAHINMSLAKSTIIAALMHEERI